MRKFRFLTILLMLSTVLSAQDKTQPADSLVRLMSAQSAEMVHEDGMDYRKVIGPARFLHNNTYLICDTAYWDVSSELIKAFGHVQILQDETVLTSEKLDYYIKDNLAQFRGTLVQLTDKDKNTLRTHNLDYNTKDSVAIFFNGASMRDKDGQIIESSDGSYDSKVKVFKFDSNVNMYADSVFIKTESLTYCSPDDVAEFQFGVDAWKDDDMLSALRGTYDRRNEIFHFYDSVHGLTNDQEGWADTLHFNKNTKNIEMHGVVQLSDRSRHVSGLAEHIYYDDSLSTVTMIQDATIVAEVKDSTDTRDTLYCAADRIIYRSIPKCEVDSMDFVASSKRLSDLDVDPVSEYRAKAAQEAQKAADEKAKQLAKEQGRMLDESGNPVMQNPGEDPQLANLPSRDPSGQEEQQQEEDPSDNPEENPDESGAEESPEEVQEPLDSTKVAFIDAIGKVRIFKSDMQARCDSLVYTDLDSLARMYIEPIVWNEGSRQYVSDSLTVIIQNGRMSRASLMSNAFITIQEDSLAFDQIRGAEMMAYFDDSTVLERFDALGEATAVFYLEENDALATVNKVTSKMLSAHFSNGELQRIYYFDQPHNDAYPTVQLPKEDKQMRGFKWNPELRPNGKEDITPYEVRETERYEYESRSRAKFKQTDIYFPGYMESVYKRIAERDSLKAARKLEEEAASDVPMPLDSLSDLPIPPEMAGEISVAPDTVALKEVPVEEVPAEETVKEGNETPAVTEETPQPAETPQEKPAEAEQAEQKPANEEPAHEENTSQKKEEIELSLDELKQLGEAPADPKQAAKDSLKALREIKQAERDSLKAKKTQAREEKWARLDAKDEAKQALKDQKKLDKRRLDVAQKLEVQEQQAGKEQRLLERYMAKYQKKKAKAEVRAEAQARKEALKPPKKSKKKSAASSDEEGDDVKDDL